MDRKDELKNRLVRDLVGFADPESVVARWRNSELVVSWAREGSPLTEHFKLGGDAMARSGAVLHPTGKNGSTSYPEFIRGIANLDHLSNSVIRSAEREEREEKEKGIAHSCSYYVPTKALVAKGEGEEGIQGNSDSLLLQEIEAAVKGEFIGTPVFFVKGDAGAGKTVLLKRFRIQQAKNFAAGKAKFLFLYVSAQGRSLSRLDDAIAGELGKLRAAFSTDAVPALVRNKLLVPIVDGFDELLGSQGYSGAFGSLQVLLNELEGDGAMVVSARSAFYEAEFIGAMSGEDQSDMQVVRVSLQPWGDGEISQFLSGIRGVSELPSEDSKALKSLPRQDRELLGKPFFTAQFPEYVDKGGDRGFLDFLVDAFIERESKKIVGDNEEPLLDPEKHRSVFLEIAEAMWTRGERDLGRGDLEDIAEVALCDLLEDAGEAVEEFKKKIASYGGMKAVREGAEMKFRFEHDVYFEHFLSQMIRDKLRESLREKHVPTILNSGILPAVAVRLAVGGDEMHDTCLRLVDALSKKPLLRMDEKTALNLGQMLASSFAVRGEQGVPCQDLTVRGIKFRHCAFEGACLQNVRFVDCVFNEVDMVGSTLEQCEMEGCRVEGPLIVSTKNTRLGIKGLMPGQNISALIDKYGKGEIWGPPERIFEILQGLGAILPSPDRVSHSDRAKKLVELLRRFIRVYRSRNKPCEEDINVGVFQYPRWGELRDLLLKHGIIRKETIHPSGSPKTVFPKGRGITSMEEVIKCESVSDDELPEGKVGDLWREIRAM